MHLKSSALPLPQHWLPYQPTMLLHIKGRTHVQTRLCAPTYRSINRGDCFVLLADHRHLYRFVGQFANVIERTRSRAICAAILEHRDLGYAGAQRTEYVITDGKAIGASASEQRHQADFWRLLGRSEEADAEQHQRPRIAEAGHADEDDVFESCLTQTNMIYEYRPADECLAPVDRYWATAPRIDVLQPDAVLVFHFGAEVYVWTGRAAPADAKRAALRLTHELFASAPPDYAACAVSPVHWSRRAGDRSSAERHDADDPDYCDDAGTPAWCLLARVTQNGETVLFREKFIDWPEFERDPEHHHAGHLPAAVAGGGRRPVGSQMRPLNGAQLWAGEPYEDPNLVLEMTNLGRGNSYYDTDTRRHYDVRTQSVRKWHIGADNDDDAAGAADAGDFTEAAAATYAHFYARDSYVVRWMYRVAVTVRELGGQAMSRRAPAADGRDRCVYYCWQGREASATERGAGALLTVELDREKGAQVRVAQGDETTAFVRLFGVLFVHRGSSRQRDGAGGASGGDWSLWTVAQCGDADAEVVVSEVQCTAAQLRSRASMLAVNRRTGVVFVWHGCAGEEVERGVAERVARKELAAGAGAAAGLSADMFAASVREVDVRVVHEGEETAEFWRAVGGSAERRAELYASALLSAGVRAAIVRCTPRLFHFSSTNGHMEANEWLSPFR